MSAEFVPFLPSLRARLASPATASQGFAPASAAVATRLPAGEVKVEVKRSGERITHIQIQCRCGELIEIECDY